ATPLEASGPHHEPRLRRVNNGWTEVEVGRIIAQHVILEKSIDRVYVHRYRIAGGADFRNRAKVGSEIAYRIAIIDVVHEALSGGNSTEPGPSAGRAKSNTALVLYGADILRFGSAQGMALEIDRMGCQAISQVMLHGFGKHIRIIERLRG